MQNRVLIDSSFLFALNNVRDKHRAAVLSFIRDNKDIRVIPDIVLAEVAYMLRVSIGQHAVLRFLDQLVISAPQLAAVTLGDLKRAREIMATYDTADFDLADCCIMALSERLDITQVCTFDRRDFDVFRPQHCDYLEVLP